MGVLRVVSLEDFKDLSVKALMVCLAVSVLAHLVLAIFTLGVDVVKPQENDEDIQAIEVSLRELPVTETFQEEAEEAPENPTFASDRNLKTDDQTSPEAQGTNVPMGGGGASSEAKQQVRKQRVKKRTTFSLTEEDIVAMKAQKEAQTISIGRKGVLNPGFERRLKRGEMLKVNAKRLDYASYINRMRRKISQVWNPQATYRPDMNTYQEISVTIGLVLNSNGEIIHRPLTRKSLFDRFDREAIRALEESAPFPNPPKSLIQEDGRVYLPWTFSMSLRNWGIKQVR